MGQSRTSLRHDHHRNPIACPLIPLHHQGSCSPVKGLLDKRMAIASESLYGYEEGSLAYPCGMVCNVLNVDPRIPDDPLLGNVSDQIPQLHNPT